MKFTGLQPFAYASGIIDVSLSGERNVDLRNEAHIVALRFLPGRQHMSIAYDFAFDDPGETQIISLEFVKVELVSMEPYLETGVDPGYGHALLFGMDYWSAINGPYLGREGFSVSCTVMDLSFYAEEIKATVSKG